MKILEKTLVERLELESDPTYAQSQKPAEDFGAGLGLSLQNVRSQYELS